MWKFVALFILYASAALAQNPPFPPVPPVVGGVVRQDGTITIGNCAQWTAQGRLGQAAAPCGAGGGSPGAPDQSIQFNDGGSFAGLSFFKKTNAAIIQLSNGALEIDAATLRIQNGSSVQLDQSGLLFTGTGGNSTAILATSPASTGEGLGFQGGIQTGGSDLSTSDGNYIQAIQFQKNFQVDHIILHEELNASFDNAQAAGDVNFTLLDPTGWVKGLPYSFCVLAAQNLKVIATGGATIWIGANQSVANGNIISNVVGSCVELISRDFAGVNAVGSDWVAKSFTGTWIVN